MAGMALRDACRFVRFCKSYLRMGPRHVEKPEAGRPRLRRDRDERLVDEAHERGRDSSDALPDFARYRARRSQREGAGEHRELAEDALFHWRQATVAPVERRLKGLVAHHPVALALHEQFAAAFEHDG